MRGAVMDLLAAARLHHLAAVEHRDAIGDLEQQRQVVRDEEDRELQLLLQLRDLRQDLPLDDDVERGRRLVHDHDLGIRGQRHRDHDPLAHSAGQLMRVTAQPRSRGMPTMSSSESSRSRFSSRSRSRWASITSPSWSSHPQHGIQRVHRALEHDRDLPPAQAPGARVASRSRISTPSRRAPGVRGR